ncbi:MAG TPA: MauE/DoxX family redox-associated membrane protein, partial [Thermoanaerobaculia bacterium]|nr:MauE/DoxX family redox-associated membrane protein [Thermoanaerobaculia bacterium]
MSLPNRESAHRPDSRTASAPSVRPWTWWLGSAAGVFLGAVLLVATWAKAIHPHAFAEQIRIEGLDFLLPAMAVVYLALALEGAIGVALLTNLRRLWVLVPATLLVLFFLFLTGRGWYLEAHGLREEVVACGCFGTLVERTPEEAFWQDLLLLVPPLVLAFLGRPRNVRRFPPVRTALVAGAALVTLVLAWQAPNLPLDDLATRLSPGVEVAALCAGGGGGEGVSVCLDAVVPELASGEHLVVLAELEDEAFTAAVDRLNAHAFAARSGDLVPLWVLTTATPEAQRAFFWQWAPVFEIREVPEALVAPLYRRLPR